MHSLKQQRIAVKFCVKLGRSATETFAMLNTVYSVLHVSSGMNVSRVADSRLATISVLGVFQRQLTTHTLKRSTPWCAQLVV